jgi:hypothetical protein
LVGKPGRRLYLKEVGWDYVDWIYLTPDMDQWQFLMEKQINIRFTQNMTIFLNN